MLDEDRKLIEAELNSGSGAGFYKPRQLAIGTSEEIVVVSVSKNTQTKFPIKDKNGNDLGYAWRFRLKDGRVWDVSNSSRKELLRGLHPESPKETVPGRFKVTNIGRVIDRKPAVQVEFLGPADESLVL